MDLSKIEKFYAYAPDDTYLGCFRVFRNQDNYVRKVEIYGVGLSNEFIRSLNEGDLYYSNTKMSLSSVRRLFREKLSHLHLF